jgi:hypothetical protein
MTTDKQRTRYVNTIQSKGGLEVISKVSSS